MSQGALDMLLWTSAESYSLLLCLNQIREWIVTYSEVISKWTVYSASLQP